MIRGIGVDYVAVARVARMLERHGERARMRLFTPAERAACLPKRCEAECLAVRFAAKEAFLKALGTGLADGIRWREMEVVPDARGRPTLSLSGHALRSLRTAGGDRVHLSLTHDGAAAIAFVVIEGTEA
ncbi:MAG: holo-ACP synthase [Gemmatimonadota bacterium]